MKLVRMILLNILVCVNLNAVSQTISKEASEQITQYISTLYLNYNGDYFSITDFSSGKPGELLKYLHEYKNLSFKTDSLPISFIDSLNGYQWKGSIIIKCSATRSIRCDNFPANPSTRRWTRWYLLNNMIIPYSKKNGIWGRTVIELGFEFPSSVPSKEIIIEALQHINEDGVIRN